MEERVEMIADVLRLAGETHHAVYRISDGADDDWATWYADWLVNLSELPKVLGRKPVRSELTHLLVGAAKEYGAAPRDESWQTYYAREIVSRFGT